MSIGSGSKCYDVSDSNISSHVHADDESEAIQLFRHHFALPDNGQKITVSPVASLDDQTPASESVASTDEEKPAGKAKRKRKAAPAAEPTSEPDAGDDAGAEDSSESTESNDTADSGSEDLAN